MRPIAWPLGALGAAAAGLAYASLYEVRAFTLREVTVPVTLPPAPRSTRSCTPDLNPTTTRLTAPCGWPASAIRRQITLPRPW